VYGDGAQTRCFCHVADTVDAIVRLLDDPRSIGEVFNVGSTEEVSILELARRIVARAGTDSPIELVPYEEAYDSGFEDMRRRVPDTTKLELLTGWRPTYDLDAIIDAAVADARTAGAAAAAAGGGVPTPA
jgi:UDP-glucose 4-epimerase